MRGRAAAAGLFVLVCCLLSITAVHASDAVQVTIAENGRITSYFDEYWVVNVDGNLTIQNPTNRDLYEVQIRYDISSLSIIEMDSGTYLGSAALMVPRVPANSSITIPYNIVGISVTNPALPEKGVLYTGITKYAPVIYSDTFGELEKASLENATLTGRPGRLISVVLRNPTGFQFTVNSIRVFKTPEADPNQIIKEWDLINRSNPITISPDALFVRDILDPQSAEGLVYWLQADVYISRVDFIDVSNVSRYNQVNLTLPPELLNYTFNETNESSRTLQEPPDLYVRKFADQQIVTASLPVKISFIVNNFATKLYTYTITDSLPPGFTFIGGDGWTYKNGVLTYTGTISAKTADVPSYTAILNDTSVAGLDFFDAAKVDYDGKTVYSDRVRFIRQYMPSQKIYVQKRLSFEGKNDVAVTITVQNLGSSDVSNLLLKEYLQENDAFSQISRVPDEKGIWSIPSLAPGETWDVTYYTTRDTQLNVLPGLYGVPSTDVLRSLVLDNVVSSAWESVRTQGLEIIGVTLLIGLPVAYFVLKKLMHAGSPPATP